MDAKSHYQHDSLEFYRTHAARYAELLQGFWDNGYTYCSHPDFQGDRDLYRRLTQLVPSGRGLDAGCGAGARDVFLLSQLGYDMIGLDAVDENIQVARLVHPEIADQLRTADLSEPLPFEDARFDLVLCNAVVQHISADVVFGLVLSEFARVLRPGGVLQLMFKPGRGVETVVDPGYGAEGVSRSFQLYGEQELLETLGRCGLHIVEAGENGELGGLLYFDDNKPMRHCVFWAQKS